MVKDHTTERRHAETENGAPRDPAQLEREEDDRSLDLVQRLVTSALAVAVGGGISIMLAAYTALQPEELDRVSQVGLWIMAGVTGLLTAVVVLVINRRHAYSPLLAFGLLPMAVAAFWVLR